MMHLFYATYDGHTRQIAERMAQQLAAHGIKMTPKDLAAEWISPLDLPAFEPVILLAALRYGHHLPEADKFLTDFRNARLNNPLIVLSVNLVARRPGKKTAKGNPYLRKWLRRRKVTPVFAAAIAGRLDYPRYDWLDRQLIRLIMLITRGPTDLHAIVEFTDWKQVDEIAEKIAALNKSHTKAVSPRGYN